MHRLMDRKMDGWIGDCSIHGEEALVSQQSLYKQDRLPAERQTGMPFLGTQ